MWDFVNKWNVESDTSTFDLGTFASDTDQRYKLVWWIYNRAGETSGFSRSYYIDYNFSASTQESDTERRNAGGIGHGNFTFLVSTLADGYGSMILPVGRYPNGSATVHWAQCYGDSADVKNTAMANTAFGGTKRPGWYPAGGEITSIRVRCTGGSDIAAGSVFEMYKMTTPT